MAYTQRTGRRLALLLILAVFGGIVGIGALLLRPIPSADSATLLPPTDPAAARAALPVQESEAKIAALYVPPGREPDMAPIPSMGNLSEGDLEGDLDEYGEGGFGERLNWFYEQRAYPLQTVPFDANPRGLEHMRTMPAAPPSLAQASGWESLGPAPIDEGLLGLHSCTATTCGAWRDTVSGRAKAIAFEPGNPNTMYLATATGGIWKSTNAGQNFTPLTSNQPAFSVFSLEIDPNNPQTIYAGTGELSQYYGLGILKSTDGGATWRLLGADIFSGLVVTSIIVDPNNSSRVYAASSGNIRLPGSSIPGSDVFAGIYVSNDGGTTWEPQLRCSNNCYGASDLVMGSDRQTLYAAFGASGIWKTTDGGTNWNQLSGFPDRGYTRIELGIGQSGGQDVLYAGLAARLSQNGQLVPWGVIWKTTDSGASWTQLGLDTTPNYCSSQCDYDNIIVVDPRNANTVYIGGNFVRNPETNNWAGVVWKTTNGGASWTDTTPGSAVNRVLHPDMHGITLHPDNPDIVWVAHDGGVGRSTNGGQTWEHINNGLSTTQFVNIGIHPTNPNIAFGGLQDNAKARYDGTRWVGLDTGDGGYSEIDPFNPNIWYSTRFSVQGSIIQFQRNDNGGTAPLEDWQQKINGLDVNDRVQFYVPFELDRSTAGVIYLGTNRVYRTANRGDSWQAISDDLTKGAQTRGSITTINVAPGDSNTIYVGTSDGNVQVTRDRGGTWTNATRNPLPNRRVSDVAIHPTNASQAYVVYNGYNSHTASTPGHVFRTTDGGASWQNVSNDLPDVPALTVAIDPRTPNNLYVGTDLGVFASTNGGTTWTVLNQGGFPNVPVYDLELNNTTRHLWAGTYGRGVYRIGLDGPATTPTPSNTTGPTTTPTATPTNRPNATATPSGTPTATLPPGPVSGAWEGEAISFNLTSNQENVWDVRLRVPVPGCSTVINYSQLVQVGADGRFAFDVDVGQNGRDGRWNLAGQFLSSAAAAAPVTAPTATRTTAPLDIARSLKPGQATNNVFLPMLFGGTFTAQGPLTVARGTADFSSVNFGQSCDTWSGTVNWEATPAGNAVDPTPTLSPTPLPATPTPEARQGIYGQVLNDGQPASDIGLLLLRCPAAGCGNIAESTIATTRTDANGYYNFANVADLPDGNSYSVFYLNGQNGGNNANDSYLFTWLVSAITSYTAGQSVGLPAFDIKELVLRGPINVSRAVPVTFNMRSRGLTGETYAITLFDLETFQALCSTEQTVAEPAITVDADELINRCGAEYNKPYGWYGWAVDGPSWAQNDGAGTSYFYAQVTFLPPIGGSTPTPTATNNPNASPTPTATAEPAASPTPTATAEPAASPTPTATDDPGISPTPTATASATPTPTPTATASATPTPTPTTGLPTIPNGDFEQGRTAWAESSSNNEPLITTNRPTGVTPLSGEWIAWLGGLPNEQSILTSPPIALPSDIPAGQRLYLKFGNWLASGETDCTTTGDSVGVGVGSDLVSAVPLCQANNTDGWLLSRIDVSSYAGQTVQFSFLAALDAATNSNALFDDISLAYEAPNLAQDATPWTPAADVPASVRTRLAEALQTSAPAATEPLAPLPLEALVDGLIPRQQQR